MWSQKWQNWKKRTLYCLTEKKGENNTFDILQNHGIFDLCSELISHLFVIDAAILLLLSSVLRTFNIPEHWHANITLKI